MAQTILLICEDEKKNKDINKALGLAGFLVHSVPQPIEGIETAKRVLPAAIVVGMESTSDGGLAILERLKLFPETKTIPLVLLMAMNTTDYAEQARRIGIEILIESPHDPQLVLSGVRNALKGVKRSQKKIFVIDDDPVLIKLLTTNLSTKGYDVSGILDGREALLKIKNENPDLVIVDILMPNVSGWEIIQEMKMSAESRNIPVILLSSMIQKEGSPEQFEVGDYFMSKPVDTPKLLTKVEELLKKKGARS